jgi:uncharacterized protein YndB with AHSA1/START domain
LKFDVPGTPEQVWHAIATGPGISSWLFPTEVEEREGGAVTFHIAPGVDSAGVVIGWEPPVRFAYKEPDWSPGAPPLATEFIVTAASGDTCTVRLVHSLFASTEEWDGQIEGFETGWTAFFRVLAVYMKHFFGQPCTPIRVMGTADVSETEAFARMVAELGLDDGARNGAPRLKGIVEHRQERKDAPEILLRLHDPAPGIALLGAHKWGGKVHASVSLYLFGTKGAEAATRDRGRWEEWMRASFPSQTLQEQV